MSRIAFLIPQFNEGHVDSNYLRFANELTGRGVEVTVCLIDTLSLSQSKVCAEGWSVNAPISINQPYAETQRYNLNEFTDFWVFSLGIRASFLDKFQLLYAIGKEVRFVNSLDVIMHLKSKYFITSMPEMIKHPETHASTKAETLLDIVESSSKTWIAKPPAGSLGRDVFLLKPGSSNNRAILDHLCGPEQDHYTLIQEHISEISRGEKRVLIAGGEVVGQYKRIATSDHRTNLLQGASSEACELTQEESVYCNKIGKCLKDMGANYVGMDMVYPWIIEFNVINPGGLITIEDLTGKNLVPRIIDQLNLA